MQRSADEVKVETGVNEVTAHPLLKGSAVPAMVCVWSGIRQLHSPWDVFLVLTATTNTAYLWAARSRFFILGAIFSLQGIRLVYGKRRLRGRELHV